MNKFTKISFIIFQYGAFGLVLFYLLAAVFVGAAGHSSENSISIYYVLAYSLFLFLLIYYFEKYTKSGKKVGSKYKIIFIIIVLPPIMLSIFLTTYLLVEWWNAGLLILPVVLVLGLFSSFGIVILKYVLFTHNKLLENAKSEK